MSFIDLVNWYLILSKYQEVLCNSGLFSKYIKKEIFKGKEWEFGAWMNYVWNDVYTYGLTGRPIEKFKQVTEFLKILSIY